MFEIKKIVRGGLFFIFDKGNVCVFKWFFFVVEYIFVVIVVVVIVSILVNFIDSFIKIFYFFRIY